MRLLYISFLIFSLSFVKAQDNIYSKLFSVISTQTTEVTKNRLIALNVWSVNDKTSRNLNLEFDKTYKAYEYARLKGGLNGIIGIACCIDKEQVKIDVTLKKDGVSKLISFSFQNADLASALKNKAPGYNVVYDSNGNLVYENLKEGTVFESVHNLITR